MCRNEPPKQAVPKLRFKDDRGDDYPEWEKRQIKDILNYEQPQKYIVKTENYNDKYNTPVLTANKAFILGYTDEKEGIYNKGHSIIYDDFTMDCKYVEFDFKIKSSTIKILTTKKNYNLYFMFNLLKHLNLKPQGHQRSYISFLEPMQIFVSTYEEQQKIANFLSLVDKRIALQRELLDKLKLYKRGLLQAIFERKIRFKDDNGNDYPEWEKKFLGSIFKERIERANGNEELLSVTINDGIKKRSEIDLKDNSSEDKSNYKRIYVGDIAYNTMRMWQGASGISKFNGIVSPAYTVISPIIDVDIDFYGYYFKYYKIIHEFQKFSQGLTSDTWNLKFPQFAEIQLSIPHYFEQQKIANFLSSIDSRITLQQELLDKLKLHKQGLLQQMFI